MGNYSGCVYVGHAGDDICLDDQCKICGVNEDDGDEEAETDDKTEEVSTGETKQLIFLDQQCRLTHRSQQKQHLDNRNLLKQVEWEQMQWVARRN